jgi:hypothetical protein
MERRERKQRLSVDRLETRQLLSIDLVNVTGPIPGQPGAGPYGVQEVGLNVNNGAGYSVAEVGDVNNDGFDDFLIGAPTIDPLAPFPVLGSGVNAQVFLVFGSRTITGPQDWLALAQDGRLGDLSQLGQSNQTNPVTNLPGPSFDGLVFVTGNNPNSLLGASVAGVGDVNGDNIPDFMIGDPGGRSSTGGITGAGRAYLIYGSPNLVRATKRVDLDNPSGFQDLNILTFLGAQPNARTGWSVGSAGDFLADQALDIAIGAPGSSLNGQAQNGAVFVISGQALRPASSGVIDLSFVGQGGASNIPGVILSGASSGDAAGYSLANAGFFDGVPQTGLVSSDLVIGAPQINVVTGVATGSGVAYVVYGSSNIANQAIVSGGVNQISLARIGSSGANPVAGASFAGSNLGDLTGFAVSTAGDFNADGVNDILIGSPGFQNATGRATMIFGRPSRIDPPGAIIGNFNLSSLPAGIGFVDFTGPLPGSLAGWAVTAVGLINNDTINEIAIGAPGFAGGQGAVYLIPGNPDLFGSQSLANTESQPIQGLIINLSLPAGDHFLGSALSGRLGTNRAGQTVDGDNRGDLIIGAAGYSLNAARNNAGTAFALQGAFLPLPNIVSTAITSNIGVNAVNPPFTVNLQDPDLLLYILSTGSNTAGFTPPRDINPNTITVQGVPLPDPGTFTNVGDVDGDGIPDASFIFSPVSLLGLTQASRTLTIDARTLASSPFPNQRYSGSASIRVVGGGGGGGGLPTDRPFNFALLDDPNVARPQFGERILPQAFVLSRFRWRPLPVAVAYNQFLPTRKFSYRMRRFFHPNEVSDSHAYNAPGLNHNHNGAKDVFTRGRFPNGLAVGRYRHKEPVIPLRNL